MLRNDESEFQDARLVYDHRGRLLAILHDESWQERNRVFVYADGQPIGMILGTPESQTVHEIVTDHLGTPILYYRDVAHYARPWYTPFGELTDIEEVGGSAPPIDLRFPGQVDLTSSVSSWPTYYNIHRWYLPDWDRYTQADPIGLQAGQNLYLYAFANPLRIVDPLGLYGTNDCSYYDRRCGESGGSYYCEVAPYWCRWFPMYPDPNPYSDNDYEGWPRCVRKCLQDCDAQSFDDRRECLDPYPYGQGNPDPVSDGFSDEVNRDCHVKCYTGCAAWQWSVVGGNWSTDSD